MLFIYVHPQSENSNFDEVRAERNLRLTHAPLCARQPVSVCAVFWFNGKLSNYNCAAP